MAGTVKGKIFEGQIEATAEVPIAEGDKWSDLLAKIRLSPIEIRKASVGSMIDALQVSTDLDGRLDASVDWQPSAGANAVMKAELLRLATGGVVLSDRMETEVRLEGDLLIFEQINGRYAGGEVVGGGEWSLGDGAKQLGVTLTRASGGEMLLPVHPDAEDWLAGKVSARATISGSAKQTFDGIRVAGNVRVRDGAVMGIPIGDAHAPLTATVTSGMPRFHLHSVDANVAGGRLRGDLRIDAPSWGQHGVHLKSRWRLTHVNFETLLREFAGTSTIGRGDVTGDLTMHGRWIRGVKDVAGDYRFSLGGSDASAVPGLSAAGVFLGATSLAGVRFEDGTVAGRLSKGNVVIEELALTSDRVAVQADGRLGILDGRIDVDAKLMTGDFQGQTALVSSISGMAIDAVLPIGRINRLLSNRTVIVAAKGSLKSPVIQLQTGETLRANATRFAIDRAFEAIAYDNIWND